MGPMKSKSTKAQRCEWMLDNWEAIKTKLPQDVFVLMVRAGLYSIGTTKGDASASIRQLMDDIKDDRPKPWSNQGNDLKR